MWKSEEVEYIVRKATMIFEKKNNILINQIIMLPSVVAYICKLFSNNAFIQFSSIEIT